jgi:hypothetical protein
VSGVVESYLLGLATLPVLAAFLLGLDGLVKWLTSAASTGCYWCDYQAEGPLHQPRGRLHQVRSHHMPWLLKTRFRKGMYGALSLGYVMKRGVPYEEARRVQREFDTAMRARATGSTVAEA